MYCHDQEGIGMARPKTKLSITPNRALLEKIGLGNFTPAEAIAELVANCFDARLYTLRGDQEFAEPINIAITIDEDKVVVVDDGKGMDEAIIGKALTLAEDMDVHTGNSRSRMGLFGLGMKSAASSLGRAWSVTTKTTEMKAPIMVEFDLASFRGQQDWTVDLENLAVNSENELGGRDHGTAIVVWKLRQSSPSVGPVFELLGSAYKPLLGSNVTITVNGDEVLPRPYQLIDDSRVSIDLLVGPDEKWNVTGWGGLDTATHNDSRYGFHLYRNGQLIEAWNKQFFRAHLMTSRVMGELHLDFVPTNYSKKGFQTESAEWKAAMAALKPVVQNLARASGLMAKSKKDPMNTSKVISGLRTAMGQAPDSVDLHGGDARIVDGISTDGSGRSDVSSENTGDSQSDTSVAGQSSEVGGTTSGVSEGVADRDSIVVGESRVKLVYKFEDFGDEMTLWDYIFEQSESELQAVINRESQLFKSVKDPKFLGILALADVVVRFLMERHRLPLKNAIDIRDAWIHASVK